VSIWKHRLPHIHLLQKRARQAGGRGLPALACWLALLLLRPLAWRGKGPQKTAGQLERSMPAASRLRRMQGERTHR